MGCEMEDVGERLGRGPGLAQVALKLHIGVAWEKGGEEEGVNVERGGVGSIARVEVGGVGFEEEDKSIRGAPCRAALQARSKGKYEGSGEVASKAASARWGIGDFTEDC